MFPVWFKLVYSASVLVILAIYYRQYGPKNYLWFSDIALIATVPALWFESSLLASMMTLAVLIPEVIWNLSYFGQLLTGRRILGLADYMFDPSKPRYLRALSLFHVPLPPLLIAMVLEYGYDARALWAQTLVAWIVLPLTYWVTDRNDNINWVHGLFGRAQGRVHPWAYLAFLMVGFPLLIYWPTHLLMSAWLGD